MTAIAAEVGDAWRELRVLVPRLRPLDWAVTGGGCFLLAWWFLMAVSVVTFIAGRV